MQLTDLAYEMYCLSTATMRATESIKMLGGIVQYLRPQWLLTMSGEWPDRFVILNRYLRTGVEPEYFSDERWTAS